jgi:hypothetical protein
VGAIGPIEPSDLGLASAYVSATLLVGFGLACGRHIRGFAGDTHCTAGDSNGRSGHIIRKLRHATGQGRREQPAEKRKFCGTPSHAHEIAHAGFAL